MERVPHKPKTLEQMDAIVSFVKQYCKDNGNSPSLAEIAEHLGYPADRKSKVSVLVDELVEDGFLERTGRRWYNLKAAKNPPRKHFYKGDVK